MRNRVSYYAIALASLGGTSSIALAQTGAVAVAPAGSGSQTTPAEQQQGGVEDIVVTAQRRSERMQDVPISVTTLSESALASAGIATTDALVQVTPGLVINRQLAGATPYLRGVGSQSVQPGVESPVSTYIDGIYYSSAVGNIFAFNNVQQIEVLKGPQGTLFGRNATGGLINITTRDPSADFGIAGTIGYGNYDTLQGNLYVTGGSETLAADLAVYGIDQMDGYGRNILTGDNVHQNREIAVRSKILWKPSPEDTVTLSGDWSRDRTDAGAVIGILKGGVAIDGSTFNRSAPYASRTNYPDTVRVEHWGASLKYQRDLGFATLSSITAYRNLEYVLSLDQDGTPVPLVNVNLTEKTRTFQQEVMLVGDAARFNWTVGAFYFSSKAGYVPLRVQSPIVPFLNFDLATNQHTRSYAAFAQGTYELGSDTNLTLGARYTVDRRRIDGSQVLTAGSGTPGVVIGTADARAKFPKLTYRIALDHKLGPDALIYASYNRGFKSGLFSTGSVSNTPVRPETLDAFEGGLKSDLFDRVLRLNLSGFYYHYKDIQLNRIENGAGILLNAAKGRSYGGEIEATFVPRISTGDLKVNANLSLLNAKYTSFPNGPVFTVNPAGGDIQSVGDLSGNRMIRAPEFTFNLGIDYSVPLGSGSLAISGNFYHTSEFLWEPDARLRQRGYETVNAQVAYAFGADERFRVRIWGKNLTNQLYYIYALESVLGDLGDPAPPRTYGIAFDFKF